MNKTRFNPGARSRVTLTLAALILTAAPGFERAARSLPSSPGSAPLSRETHAALSAVTDRRGGEADSPRPDDRLAALTPGSAPAATGTTAGVLPSRAAHPGIAAGSLLRLVGEDGADFVPHTIIGAPGKPTQLPITLSAARGADYSLLTVRGLPEAVKLSAGFRFQNAWAVSISDLTHLRLTPDSGYEGAFTIEVSLLRKLDGAAISRSVHVDILRPGNGADAMSRVVGGGEHTAGSDRRAPMIGAAEPARLSATEEAVMIERADGLLQGGDIAAARLLYERLARRGSYKGALAMARTYDPDGLKGMAIVGLRPDMEKAREWYQKAKELGSRDAATRLLALDARLH